MTPQELALLAAVVPLCEHATLAFCLETEPTPETSWLSIWSAIGKTFQQCRAQISNLPGVEVTTEILQANPGQNRFAENSEFAWLENKWAQPAAQILKNPQSAIRSPQFPSPPVRILKPRPCSPRVKF